MEFVHTTQELEMRIGQVLYWSQSCSVYFKLHFVKKMALPRLKITLPILVLYVMILLSMQFCVFAVNFSACTRWVKENFFKISITVKHITTRSPWGEGRETHWGEGDRKTNRGGGRNEEKQTENQNRNKVTLGRKKQRKKKQRMENENREKLLARKKTPSSKFCSREKTRFWRSFSR